MDRPGAPLVLAAIALVVSLAGNAWLAGRIADLEERERVPPRPEPAAAADAALIEAIEAARADLAALEARLEGERTADPELRTEIDALYARLSDIESRRPEGATAAPGDRPDPVDRQGHPIDPTGVRIVPPPVASGDEGAATDEPATGADEATVRSAVERLGLPDDVAAEMIFGWTRRGSTRPLAADDRAEILERLRHRLDGDEFERAVADLVAGDPAWAEAAARLRAEPGRR